jgi:hypothetical protein
MEVKTSSVRPKGDCSTDPDWPFETNNNQNYDDKRGLPYALEGDYIEEGENE